ncbi:EF-hand calcium-binding domain-containing protein 5 [Malaclemys terrapin pileata]|uniref:EF-hand calcium-binding domain-containing protein 5 n=1 Tax=Malaclemys terrapin pileata TaxID=2991368 RepID=UPI0023A7D931|nr:EF-hand calcium-binding domain-containing protein 5 [Malaclemys terrapin pileata]
MAAVPEDEAQTPGLKLPKLSVKSTPIREKRRRQESATLPGLRKDAQWKETFYEKVQQRALNLQREKVEKIHVRKAEEEKIEKKEPLDWLSKEWLSEEKMTRDTRAYLLDKLLPTLVPGVEKLLMEVERKKVLETDQDPPKFDPINFLGEYLMRHNPQFDTSAKLGPYKRGMKAVMEELKTQVPDTALNRLARMKSEVKKNREQREQVEKIKSQVTEMRKEALAVQFKEWTLDVSGKLPLALVQSALRSFLDVISTPLGAGPEIYDRKLETIDTLGEKVNEEEFREYVHSHIKTFTSDTFQEFLKHLCQCADDFRDIIRHDIWRQMFTDLFLDCDHGKAGLLDRQRTLALLEDFYDSSPVIARRRFCNPRRWPIIELQEIELTEFWGDFDDGRIASEESSQRFGLSQPEVSEGRILSSNVLNGQATYETCILIDEPGGPEAEQDQAVALEQQATSESGTDEISKEEPGLIGELSEIVPVTALEEEHIVSPTEPGSEVQVNQEGEGFTAELYEIVSPSTPGEENPVSEEKPGPEGQVSQKGLYVNTEMEETDSSPHPEASNTLLETEASDVNMSQEASKSDSRKGSTVLNKETTSSEDMDTENQIDTADPESQNEPIPVAAPEQENGNIDKEHGSEERVSQEDHNVAIEPSELILAPNPEEENRILEKELGSEAQVHQEDHDLIAEPNGAVPILMPEAEGIISEEEAESEEKVSALIPENKEETADLGKEPPEEKERGSEEHGSQSELQAETSMPAEDSTPSLPHEQTLLQDQSTGPSHPPREASQAQAREAFEKTAQLIDGIPWSGDLLASDLSFRYSSYGEQIQKDWNNENSRFADLRMLMAEIQTHGTSIAMSAFDKSCLNLPQFVQLMETFVGEDSSLPTVKKLVAFVKEGYEQTEEEKIKQLEKVHREALLARRKLLLEALFEKWDNECSGYLDLKEVDAVLGTFKEGMEKEALKKAKKHLRCSHPHPGGVVKLSPKEFQTYLELVVSEFTGNEDEVLDTVVEFLTMSVAQTHMERLRGSARRKWLHNIQHAAETSGASMEPVYQAVFKALSQDAEAHGNNKKISAYIALLEQNQLSPERGEVLLRYVACTSDDAPYILNQALYRDMKGVSFAAAEEGKPVHVPRVQFHGNIHFWNYDRAERERRGSFLVLPLQDSRWRTFGILGLDSLRDQCEQTIFLTHEIGFYQGVSHVFSEAYHHVHKLENILQVAFTAVGWLCTRAPTIRNITTYLVEPGKDKTSDYILRKMMTTDHSGHMEIHSPPTVLRRRENIFRDYLFKCTDSSEVISTFAYGEPHIAVPLREPTGQAFGVFDLSPAHYQGLPPYEHKDLQIMLKMAQAACSEILKESSGETDPIYVLVAEHVADLRRAQILFHRLMLQDLRECIQKLDSESFATIKSYAEPPAVVHNVLKAVLLLFYPEWVDSEKIENWSHCVLKLDGDLIQKICCFDPTATYMQGQTELLANCIKGIPREEVWKHNSVPAEYLYNWALTCLSLLEVTKELQHTQDSPLASLTPRPSLIAYKSTEVLLSSNPSDSII